MLTGCRALKGNPPALTAAPSCPHSLSVEKLIVTVIDGFLSAGIWPGLFRERGEVQGRGQAHFYTDTGELGNASWAVLI